MSVVIGYKMFVSVFLVLLAGTSGVQGWFFFSDEPKNEDDKICLASPQADHKLNVQFLLFTRSNPTTPQDVTSGNLLQSNFNPAKDTKSIIHGYTDAGSADWVTKMIADILKFSDVNVLCVNWQKGADSMYYGQSAANTRRVGEIVGNFIKTARDVTGAPYKSHHLIGHSLGAHISGFAGAHLNGEIGRITGLDPAGPCFRFSGASDRLSHDDAIFVDTIHTDGDALIQGGFGTELRMGDVDFYPNGGEEQPGCDTWFWQHLMDLMTDWVSGFKESVACSHKRATELFQASINPAHPFKAFPCSHQDRFEQCTSCGSRGCSRMGYYSDPYHRGLYTLKTKSSWPFSL